MKDEIFFKIQDKISYGVALFGAGQNGRWSCDYLLKNGYPVTCFVDNNPALQGKKIDDIPVLSLSDYRQKYKDMGLLITAKHAMNSIMAMLYDFDNVMPFDTWFYLSNKLAYDNLYKQFADDKSRETLDGIIQTMLTGNEDFSAEVAVQNQYFCIPGFFNTIREIFVDVGTCTGDSVENFLRAMTGSFRQIYAFEPGSQATAAEIRFKRLKSEWGLEPDRIKLEHMGIGRNDGIVRLHEAEFKENYSLDMNMCGSIDSDAVQIVSLDSYFKDKEITFLKADIEGAEMDMLVGGRHTIMSQKPKIAICVYHRPDDLINIMHTLKSYVPEYRFYLRHHSSLAMETVLYCRK